MDEFQGTPSPAADPKSPLMALSKKVRERRAESGADRYRRNSLATVGN